MSRRYLLLAVLAAAPLAADAAGMRPGQWEYTMKMEMPGMPVAMPATTYKHCLTQADVDQGEQYKQDGKGDCEIKNMKQSANGASYDVACKDGTSGHYEFTTGADSMTGKGTMNTQGMAMTQSFSAKRLGDCTK